MKSMRKVSGEHRHHKFRVLNRRGAGMALAVVMMVIVFLGMLGGAFIQYMGGEAHSSARLLRQSQAGFLADSALEEAALRVRSELEIPGSQWWEILTQSTSSLPQLRQPVMPGVTSALAVELSRDPEDQCLVEVSVVELKTIPGTAPGEKSGVLRFSARIKYADVKLARFVDREFRVVSSARSFSELGFMSVSRLYRDSDSCRIFGELQSNGLSLCGGWAPRVDPERPPEVKGLGGLAFSGEQQIFPAASMQSLVVTLAGSLRNWGKLEW